MSEPIELDPSSAEYRLIAGIVRTAADTLGRPIWWNGRIVARPAPYDVGRVQPDGTLELQREATLDPIVAALAGPELDKTAVAAAVNAFTTVVHEGAHLVSRDGDELAGHPVDTAEAIALDEGLIERWTHHHVDDVLHRAGVDRVLPQVIGRELHDAYPAYTKATQTLVEGVAAMTGRSADDLEAELLKTERAHRWNRLVDAVAAHELGGELTEAERARLVTVVRVRFGECQATQQNVQHDGAAKQEHGARIGRSAVGGLADAVAAIRADRADERVAETTAVDRDPNRFAEFLAGTSTVLPGFARPSPPDPVVPPPPEPSIPATSSPEPAQPSASEAAHGSAGERGPGGAHTDQGARPPVAARLAHLLRRSARGGVHRG